MKNIQLIILCFTLRSSCSKISVMIPSRPKPKCCKDFINQHIPAWEVFWLFHKMTLCPTYNIEICETYFCHLTKHIQKVITVKYVHVATPLKTKWYIAKRQGVWIWTQTPHASPFPYISIHVHIIKNDSILCFTVQRTQTRACKSRQIHSLLGDGKEVSWFDGLL